MKSISTFDGDHNHFCQRQTRIEKCSSGRIPLHYRSQEEREDLHEVRSTDTGVDPGSVDQVWSLLKPTLPSDMAEFIAYYERTWIGSSSTDPLFDHWLWSFGITMTRYLLAYHDPITLSKVGIMAFNSYLGVRIQIFGLF